MMQRRSKNDGAWLSAYWSTRDNFAAPKRVRACSMAVGHDFAAHVNGRARAGAGAGAGAADTGKCRRANNCTDNRTAALTTAGAEWTAAGCSGRGV